MELSVVVATFNQSGLLVNLLASLKAQTLDPARFEVVVVDDGSTDATPRVLEAAGMPNLRALRHANRGPAVSRNRGAAASRGAVIAFTDTDCEPAPDWAEQLLAAFARHPDCRGIEGAVHTVPEAVGPFTHQVENVTGGAYCTANMAYRRAAFDAVGGFDEDFGYGHEDTDLAIRVGGPLPFAPEARVVHPPVPMSFGALVRRPRVWMCQVVLAVKHPRLYRDGHGRSPFRTLTWHYGVVQFLQRLWRFRAWAWKAPITFVRWLFAMFLQRVYLLAYFPKYVSRFVELTRSPARRLGRLLAEQAFHDALFAGQDARGCELDAFVEHALALLGAVRGLTILDCGCGDGALTVRLATEGATVIALDVSIEALALTRRRAQAAGVGDRVRTVLGSLEELPFRGATFDRAIGSLVVHHVDAGRAGPEIARVLGDSGSAAFSENFAFNPFLMLARNHLLGLPGIPRLGTVDERPLDGADVTRFAGRLKHELVWPELLFFRLLDRQVFKYRVHWISVTCLNIDRWLFESLPALRHWSYRGTLVVWRA